jgi:hypothetical protein
MEVRLTDVHGFMPACRAVRLSFNSQSKSDSTIRDAHGYLIGINEEDRALLLRLIKNGDSHAKVMRMVQVWLDIRAPVLVSRI